MALRMCSLAGVDETTPLFELAVVSDLYGFAEWAFLYSPDRPRPPGRYPSVARLQRALGELPRYVRLALHISGAAVGDLLAGEPVVSGLVKQVGARSGRVQLDLTEADAAFDGVRLREFMLQQSDVAFITLHDAKNPGLSALLAGVPNHAVLFDTPPVRGAKDRSWPEAEDTKCRGYAGGLGIETLERELPRIYAAAGQADFWIGLGDLVRDQNDRFDVHAARHCLELVALELSNRIELPRQHPRRRQCELIDLFDAGLTDERESVLDFEMMLQHMVHASRDTLDPNLMEIRRKAEVLLLRKGNVLPSYAQAPPQAG